MSPVAAGASGSSMSTGSGMERRLKKKEIYILFTSDQVEFSLSRIKLARVSRMHVLLLVATDFIVIE